MYVLHKELQKYSVDSQLLVQYKTIPDASIIKLYNKDELELRNMLENFPMMMYKANDLFSNALIDSSQLLDKINEINPDIVHLHWICGGMLSIEDIAKINKPIIWTIRDWWAMTGGCHHPKECLKYTDSCGNCPILKSQDKNDLSWQNLNRKIKSYNPSNITIVGISKFMSAEVKKSSLFAKFNIRTINNNIDDNIFYPLAKSLARDKLKLSTHKKIVSIGAYSFFDEHKGMKYFLESLNFLNANEIFILFFGRIDNSVLKDVSFEYISLGYINDKFFLRDIYSASDLFIAPYLFEPFGKTIAESMACGTPVVCFENAGGPSEIIMHKVDGYLAKKYDSFDLANGVKWILNNKEYKRLSLNAIQKVAISFSAKKSAQEYIKLYNEKISNGNIIFEDIKEQESLYRNLKKIDEFKNLVNRMDIVKSEKIIIYGYSYMGIVIEQSLKNKNIIFVDKDMKKVNNKNVFHPDEFNFDQYDKIIVAVINRGKLIVSYLQELNIDETKIIDVNKFLI